MFYEKKFYCVVIRANISCDKPTATPASRCDASKKNVTFYYYEKSNDTCVKNVSCYDQTGSGSGRFRTKKSCENFCRLEQGPVL